MAHEDLMAELDRRRARGGPDGRAPRSLRSARSRGQLNAQERLEQSGRSGILHRDGAPRRVWRLQGRRVENPSRRQARGLREDRRPRRGGGRQRLHRCRRLDERDELQEDGARTAYRHREGHAVRPRGRIDRGAAPRRDGLTRHGIAARERPDAVSPLARDAVGGGGARYIVRLLRMALLLLGFRRDEKGLHHGGVEPSARVHGNRRAGRPRGARRLAHPRRLHRVSSIASPRPMSRRSRRSARFLSYMPSHNMELPPTRASRSRTLHRTRSRSSTSFPRSGHRSTTCARSSRSSPTAKASSS